MMLLKYKIEIPKIVNLGLTFILITETLADDNKTFILIISQQAHKVKINVDLTLIESTLN